MSGVAFTEPHPDHIPGLMASINGAFAQVPADAHGALVGIATESGGNAALVVRVGETVKVETWIGKSWGTPKPSYGVAILKTF
jgi:hypothetical protein